ncbi:forkhead box protein P2-like isoform X1 [Heterodontus francisci]|uniref:forkhead box protein P2-like isoform X1 n=1 Tax=Heterodontus francisci TaxID=7792 RepID=UPI00355B27D9
MTGAGKPNKSGENRVLGNGTKHSTATGLPQQQPAGAGLQPLVHLNPLHYRQLVHLQQQGLLSLMPAHLAVTRQVIPQGGSPAHAAWSRQDPEPVHSAEPAVCASGLPANRSYASPVGSSAVRPTPVIVYYNAVNGEGLIPPSVRERDPGLLNPLFFHGFCKWPGCEQLFNEYESFLKHLDEVHCLNDTSTAQCLIQKEKVNQLESKLVFEKERLLAMQTQLEMKVSEQHPLHSLKALEGPMKELTASYAAPFISERARLGASSAVGLGNSETRTLARHRLQEKHSVLFSDINPALEYYRICNVRPPLTYAALIRWAILETEDRQLTLNEIYHWFTRTFAFFRYNTATWKNAVRHNLSLHKCFVRVENVKGAVWTVDEVEFQRRRGQKIGRLLEQDGTRNKATHGDQR